MRELFQYRSRIPGPLLDRIDIHIEVPAVKYRELADQAEGEVSANQVYSFYQMLVSIFINLPHPAQCIQ
jgi:predicted ATPase with chaperone activity